MRVEPGSKIISKKVEMCFNGNVIKK